MSLVLPIIFTSPSTPSHSIQYTHLNPGAPHTVLFCYGANGRSQLLTLFQTFAGAHPELQILIIDRWTQGSTASRSGLALLSELTSISLELLDSLHIDKFSIAAHSAGAYQMLSLAASAPQRVIRLFPISTHLPAPYTDSSIMTAMCTVPGFVFRSVMYVDQLSDTPVERIFLRLVGSKKADQDAPGVFVDNRSMREVLSAYNAPPEQVALRKERADLDYRQGYSRIPGITLEVLEQLHVNCSAKVTWFTCDADVFFGPKSVERIKEKMPNAQIEIVLVPEASHADIFMRSGVWERICAETVEQS